MSTLTARSVEKLHKAIGTWGEFILPEIIDHLSREKTPPNTTRDFAWKVANAVMQGGVLFIAAKVTNLAEELHDELLTNLNLIVNRDTIEGWLQSIMEESGQDVIIGTVLKDYTGDRNTEPKATSIANTTLRVFVNVAQQQHSIAFLQKQLDLWSKGRDGGLLGRLLSRFGDKQRDSTVPQCAKCKSRILHFGFTQSDRMHDLSIRGQANYKKLRQAARRNIGGTCSNCDNITCLNCYDNHNYTCPICGTKIAEL